MLSRFNSLEISCLSRKVDFRKRGRSLGEYFDVCRPALRTTTASPSSYHFNTSRDHTKYRAVALERSSALDPSPGMAPIPCYQLPRSWDDHQSTYRSAELFRLDSRTIRHCEKATVRLARFGHSLALNNRQPELLFLSVCSAMYNG